MLPVVDAEVDNSCDALAYVAGSDKTECIGD